MSDAEREVYKDVPEIREEEYIDPPEYEEVSEDDFEARAGNRRRRTRRRRIRRKVLIALLLIAAFATLATMCGRDIIRLKAENLSLIRQQRELEEERDKLKSELEKSGDREYVQEQARKQLRLLNPGELLFTFDEEEPEEPEEPEDSEETEEAKEAEEQADE